MYLMNQNQKHTFLNDTDQNHDESKFYIFSISHFHQLIVLKKLQVLYIYLCAFI